MNTPIPQLLSAGTIINATNEIIMVYGGSSLPPYDNDFHGLKPGQRTADGWDCDGFYLPNDRIIVQQVMPNKKGPAAVKIKNYQTASITQDYDQYKIDTHNWGVYRLGEINWYIPNNTAKEITEIWSKILGN
ncbi:hypothetical protein ABE58_00485 [Bacillus safensis]|nr:hypothetical protein [Bacillus safensis]